MNVTSILGDDELVSVEQVREALGAPDKPVSRRTISRLLNRPDGLPHIEIAGRKWLRMSVLRDYVRKRERHPNARRKRA